MHRSNEWRSSQFSSHNSSNRAVRGCKSSEKCAICCAIKSYLANRSSSKTRKASSKTHPRCSRRRWSKTLIMTSQAFGGQCRAPLNRSIRARCALLRSSSKAALCRACSVWKVLSVGKLLIGEMRKRDTLPTRCMWQKVVGEFKLVYWLFSYKSFNLWCFVRLSYVKLVIDFFQARFKINLMRVRVIAFFELCS